MLRTDPAYAERAARISGLAKDIAEYLATLPLEPAQAMPQLTVAYHSACSLQHGQRVTRQPKELLSQARLRGEGRAGRSSVLRLGRHLQYFAARLCKTVARAQSRDYREIAT